MVVDCEDVVVVVFFGVIEVVMLGVVGECMLY